MKQKSLGMLIRLLQELRRIDPEFPIQYALCLAEIGRQDGLSITELAQRTGIALSTVSRIISALSGSKGPCGGLVRVKFSSTEARRKELSLTSRGISILTQLETELENGSSFKKAG